MPRPPSGKVITRLQLAEAFDHLKILGLLFKRGKRWTPAKLYKELDGVIGRLCETQVTLEQRCRVRTRKRSKGDSLDVHLWWPRYWKRVQEMKAAGVDPKGPEAVGWLEDLGSDLFN